MNVKIKILSVPKEYQPNTTKIKFPKHNADFGIEQDFYLYLKQQRHLITDDHEIANFHYLPIYWTRYFLNSNYGAINRQKFENDILQFIINRKKTIVICQYADGPLINTTDMKLYLGSRSISTGAFDLPLLSANHIVPKNTTKKFLACFRGRYETHEYRKIMFDVLRDRRAIMLSDKQASSKKFKDEICASYISLCPRGHGGNSFRFYESMQLGVVPLLFGDIDTRPFKKQINWNECSLFAKNEKELYDIFNALTLDNLILMGKNAKRVYDNMLCFGKWQTLFLNELEENI